MFIDEIDKNAKLLRNTNLVEAAIQSYFAKFGLKTKIQQKTDEQFLISVSGF